jgi:hypothetical protein
MVTKGTSAAASCEALVRELLAAWERPDTASVVDSS